MLSLFLYPSQAELFSLSYIKKESPLIIVVPSPTVADHLRSQFHAKHSTVTILTFSKFIDNELKSLLGDRITQFKRKSELFLLFASTWKRVGKGMPSTLFFDSFKLFTDLRSLTLDEEVIEEILPHFDSKIARVVRIFFAIASELKVLDEHSALYELASRYRDMENFPLHLENGKEVQLLFIGFKAFTAAQVDLLKAISIRHNITVPYSESLYRESASTDWVRWLTMHELPKSKEQLRSTGTIRCVRFTKNRLGEKLVSYTAQSNKKYNYLLCKKGPTILDAQEIPAGDQFFKAEIELFVTMIQAIYEEIVSTLMQSETLSSSQLFDYLDKEIRILLNSTSINYLRLTALQLWKSSLASYVELSEQNMSLALFDLYVLFEHTKLSSPRVSALNKTSIKPSSRVVGLEHIEEINFHQGEEWIVVASSNYPKIQINDGPYPPAVMEILAATCPLRNKETELLQIQDQLREILIHENVTLFLEHDLETHEAFWSQILSSNDLVPYTTSPFKFDEKKDFFTEYPFKHELPKLSATRVQSFLDCKRQYYFTYIEDLSKRVTLTQEVTPDIIGVLEHRILEIYFSQFQGKLFIMENLESIVASEINSEIKKRNLKLSRLSLLSLESEILYAAQNGVEFIDSILARYNDAYLEFEKKFHSISNMRGSVDLYIKHREGVILLDFKRSASSIPTAAESLGFEKIQLWTYLRALLNNEPLLLAGYLNLSEPKESLLFVESEDSLLERVLKESKEYKFTLIDNLLDSLTRYGELEDRLIAEMKVESLFSASPRHSDCCKYCSIRLLCQKGGDDEQEDS